MARANGVAALLVAVLLMGACDSDAGTTELFAADFEPVTVDAPDCDYGGNVRSVEAENRVTVRFELCSPDVAFASKMASPIMGIFPRQVLDEIAEDGGVLEEPVGTGPWRFGAWDEGEELRFERFGEYRGKQAVTETLVIRWDNDENRLAALGAGDADGIDRPAPQTWTDIDGDADLQLWPRTGVNVIYVGLNSDIAPFDDIDVRRAVVLALDRPALAADELPAGSEPATQTYPPSLAGWTRTPVWPEHDPEGAVGLLGDVELSPITLSYPDESTPLMPDPGRVAAGVAAQLTAVGIPVTPEPMDAAAFTAAADQGELDMFLGAWAGLTADTGTFFEDLFGETAPPRFGDVSAIESAIEETEFGSNDRRYLANETAGTVIIDQSVMIPLGWVNSAAAFQDDVVDTLAVPFGLDEFQPTASPVDAEYFYSFDPGGRETFVWMQESEPESLVCTGTTDNDTLRVCAQTTESLMRFEIGSGEVVGGLAEVWTPNDDATTWTFRLVDNVVFHDGSDLDAGDVVRSFVMQWDASDPLHVGDFSGFEEMFGGFIGETE